MIFISGCTKHPGDFKYCKAHKDEQTPAVSSSKLHVDSRARLRSSKHQSKHYQEQDFTDSVYIIEGSLGSFSLQFLYKLHFLRYLGQGNLEVWKSIISSGKTIPRLHGNLWKIFLATLGITMSRLEMASYLLLRLKKPEEMDLQSSMNLSGQRMIPFLTGTLRSISCCRNLSLLLLAGRREAVTRGRIVIVVRTGTHVEFS